MPLDDREQRILEEIERQFYQEDPRLAETVRSATLASVSRGRLKWAFLGVVIGFVLVLAFFTRMTLVALFGFGMMVMSAAWVVAIVRKRSGVGAASPESMVGRMRRRWRSR